MNNIAVTLAWLKAVQQLNWFSLLLAGVGYLHGATWSLLPALLVQYYFLRLAFDSRILQIWLDEPEQIAQFDVLLVQLGLAKPMPQTRELEQRLAGCVRLSKVYLGLLLGQCVVLIFL